MLKYISIIIPVLNAEKFMQQCLIALEGLDYLKDSYEIIVVDNGSTDATFSIVCERGLKVLSLPKATVASLRNLGAKHAKGEILAFIDVDCLAPMDWLSNAVEFFQNDMGIGAVGAEYLLPDNPSWVEVAWDLQIATRRTNGEVEWVPSGDLFVRKEVFEQICGFDANLATSEDYDFCKRMRKVGYKLIADASVAVVHVGNPKTLGQFIRKQLWHGKGVVQNFMQSPTVNCNNALYFGIYTALCTLFAILGAGVGVMVRNWSLFLFGIIILFMPPVMLAVRSIVRTKKSQYLLSLSFLYFVYGMARAMCVLDFRNYVLNRSNINATK